MKHANHAFVLAATAVAALAAAVAAVPEVAFAASTDAPAAAGRATAAVSRPRTGLWIWKEQYVRDEAERAALIEFAQKHDFNLLLVQVHTDRDKAGHATLRYPDGLRQLVIAAAAKGIAIEALDGAPDMGRAAAWANTLSVLDAVLAFDRALPEGAHLAGVHYDIEPYLLPGWKTPEREAIMVELLQLYAAIGARLRLEAPHMTLAADIPFWYDHKTEPGDSCVVTFMGAPKNIHEHIQDLTDYVGIMSYRRKAVGDNSIVYHCQAELAYAARIGRAVMPAMETGPVKETPTISFYGTPAEQFWEQKQLVEKTLADNPAYGGMLIHSYTRLRDYLAGAEKN